MSERSSNETNVRNHKFVFQETDYDKISFFEFFKRIKEDISIYREAGHSIANALALFHVFVRYTRDIKLEAEELGYKKAAAMIATGDNDFDLFRQRCVNNDWYYDYSDDNNVWRAGKERTEALKKEAETKGGLYLTYYNKVTSELRR